VLINNQSFKMPPALAGGNKKKSNESALAKIIVTIILRIAFSSFDSIFIGFG